MSAEKVRDGLALPSTEELVARVEELTRRVEWLEASLAEGKPVPTDVAPDVVLVISAAVAAYLGKRARVRAVHLADSATWAQQGRASIMASHSFAHGPGPYPAPPPAAGRPR